MSMNLLGRLGALRQASHLQPQTILIDGKSCSVQFRQNVKCKRMVLRVTPDGLGVTVTLPPRTSLATTLRFIENSKAWISKMMAGRALPVKFADAQCVSYRGVLHVVRATGGKRGLVTCMEGLLLVPGEPLHVARRLKDWLKAQAARELAQVSQSYATAMDAKYRKLTIRDQATRWGSCSATGNLSYSWRLILAPPYVLDYVAAHEVAHLKEMNHSASFWRLVITHCAKAKDAKRWLRDHGRDLHRYGA